MRVGTKNVNVTKAPANAAQINQCKAVALKNNPRGVRAITYNLEANIMAMAAYVGFKATQPMKDLLDDLEEADQPLGSQGN